MVQDEDIDMSGGRMSKGKWTEAPYITLLQRCGITMCEDLQEVARSALVNGIESKMAALICRAALGLLQWNITIFGLAWTC
jgi:hypothetical protein